VKKRFRISVLQVRILLVLRAGQQGLGSCCPTSLIAKLMLFGRRTCASNAERVALFKSVRRLVANDMIIDRQGDNRFRITPKAVAWLEAEGYADRAEHVEVDPTTMPAPLLATIERLVEPGLSGCEVERLAELAATIDRYRRPR
jgi:hypothetical protein